jgi:hypothetical protein
MADLYRSRTHDHLRLRPTRGHNIAWFRVPVIDGREQVGIEYRVFLWHKKSQHGIAETRAFLHSELPEQRSAARSMIAHALVGMRRRVRWRRDQIELGKMAPPEDETQFGLNAFMTTLEAVRKRRRGQLGLANMGLADETPAPEMPA